MSKESILKMSGDKQQLKILMICPLRYVGAMAFVMESIIGFAKRGHFVDVLVSDNADPSITFHHPHIHIYTFRDSELIKGIQYFKFLRKSWWCTKTRRYDLIVGLSQIGIITAAYLKRHFGVPYIFFNDEIWFGNERQTLFGNAFGYTMKFLERRSNQTALCTVTQDPIRGRFVAKTNRISIDSMLYLPNSQAGKAEISSSTYLYDHFGFPTKIKIVLWLGAVTSKGGALELAQEACEWPEDYRLVFHFRTNRPTAYMQKIMNLHGSGKVYISQDTIPFRDVKQLAGSATIGLGIYEDRGVNVRFIGASSGKINTYLQMGIPVIVSDFEGMTWLEKAGAGICVQSVSEILSATRKILAEYPSYQRRAVNVFEKQLSFDKHFSKIAEKLEKSITSRTRTLHCGHGVKKMVKSKTCYQSKPFV